MDKEDQKELVLEESIESEPSEMKSHLIELTQDDYGYNLTVRAATGRRTQGVWQQRIPSHASLAEMGVILHEMAENLQKAYMEHRLWERLQ